MGPKFKSHNGCKLFILVAHQSVKNMNCTKLRKPFQQLNAPLLYQRSLFYREVSLQDSHPRFVIVYDRYCPILKMKTYMSFSKNDMKNF